MLDDKIGIAGEAGRRRQDQGKERGGEYEQGKWQIQEQEEGERGRGGKGRLLFGTKLPE